MSLVGFYLLHEELAARNRLGDDPQDAPWRSMPQRSPRSDRPEPKAALVNTERKGDPYPFVKSTGNPFS
jgi:hypothetical protein